MNNSVIELSQIDINELRRSITALKKLMTLLESIMLRDAHLFCLKDRSTLESTPEILEHLIKKKSALIKKVEAYNKKL